jgi:outer membrane receptor protein involved in Fe transport
MNKKTLLSATALRSVSAFAIAAAFAGQAYAQDTQPAADAQPNTPPTEEQAPAVGASEVEAQSNTTADTSGEVIVTGSRIRRPNLESTVPITSISGESLIKGADTNIGDQLNELPQLRSTFSQQNPGLGIGIAGLNLLDLRGLGTVRTLVLVNGRRHVAADILNNAVSPDVNSIPNDLIERVDIVTGGNSAIYGSDAIAGVVNFVLRRDFDGIQVRGQTGSSTRGFADDHYVSAMVGKNFDDDRANLTLHGEFAKQDRVFGSQLPWLRQVNGQIITDVDPAFPASQQGSDNVPDATFQQDIRSASIHRWGLVPITQPGTAPLCGVGTAATNGPPNNLGSPYNCTFVFDQASALAAQTGTRVGSGIIGSILGGNGQNGREETILSMRPDLKRYNFNLLGRYTISDALEPFVEAKFTRLVTRGNNAGPSFIQGTFGQFDFRERQRLDNPFLTPAQRTTIANAILLSGCNTSLTAACMVAGNAASFTRSSLQGQGIGGPLNAADQAAIAAGTYRFVVARQLLDAGIRDEFMRRNTYRAVVGARGTFNDDWSYEVSLNYGKFKEKKTTFGFLDRQRFMLALDAGVNPATGAIECRSQFDPASAVGYDVGAFQAGGRANTGQAARLAADIAACVPYNPFGSTDNSAAVDYFSYNARASASLRQFVAGGFVSGDSSQWFELPGGPARFAIGAEYRREKGDYIDDPFVNDGNPLLDAQGNVIGVNATTQSNTNAVVIGRFNPPAFKVTEGFAELQLPIVKEIPVFHELTLSGAARVAKYSGAVSQVGTVWAYNAGLDWAPVRDIRFRGNYSRSVRAPNLSELYFPPVPNFSPGFQDPCQPNQIGNNPNRLPNCTAAFAALGIPNSLQNIAISLPVISGSNPNLTEETADSYTVGAVIQPRMIPGLAISVDYYDITVKDVIVSLGAQQIANNCYDAPDLNNVFCSLFQRHAGPGLDPFGQQPGQIAGNSLIQAGVNFAARKREGLDVNVAYRRDIPGVALINTNLIFTHNFKTSNYEDPARPEFENRILGELGDPKNEFRWDTDITRGMFTLGYRMRYIGKMYTSLYENFNALPDNCHFYLNQNCFPLNSDVAAPAKYPSVFYHDLRGEVNFKDLFNTVQDLNLYVGVDNVFDKHPPLGLSGTGTTGITDRGTGNAAIYDALGRRWYAGFKARF